MKKTVLCLLLCLSLLPAARGSEIPITRGGFLLLLWEDAGGVPFDKTAHPFSDLSDDMEAQAVAWAWDLGLVQGVGGNLFAPGRPLTREECALLLRRNDALLGRNTFLPDGVAACNDFQDVSPWAGDSLYWACITGRIPWRQGRLDPRGTLTREEAQETLIPIPAP